MAHFLKPIVIKEGDTPEAVNTTRITFSQEKQPKIREGHILILFSKESHKLISYVSTISGMKHDPDNKEHPWFVHTKDWAPEYSKRWWTFDNVLEKLAAAHLALNPSNMLAVAKKLDEASFATFITGKSSQELNDAFANSLINTIKGIAK